MRLSHDPGVRAENASDALLNGSVRTQLSIRTPHATQNLLLVIPAKAGIQFFSRSRKKTGSQPSLG
jgi:hypothetical protein